MGNLASINYEREWQCEKEKNQQLIAAQKALTEETTKIAREKEILEAQLEIVKMIFEK